MNHNHPGNAKKVFKLLQLEARGFLTCKDFDGNTSEQLLHEDYRSILFSNSPRGGAAQAAKRQLQKDIEAAGKATQLMDEGKEVPKELQPAKQGDGAETPTAQPASPTHLKSRMEMTFDERQEETFRAQIRKSRDLVRNSEDFFKAQRRKERKQNADHLDDMELDSTEEFMDLLRKRYGSVTRGWRSGRFSRAIILCYGVSCVEDPDSRAGVSSSRTNRNSTPPTGLCAAYDQTKLSFTEFCQQVRNLGYAGNVKSLWRSLDRDSSGHITLHDLDPAAQECIDAFNGLCKDRYGNILNAWKQGLDTNGNGRLDMGEFTERCAFLGYKGDAATAAKIDDEHPEGSEGRRKAVARQASRLFQLFSLEQGKPYLTMHDLDPKMMRNLYTGHADVLYQEKPSLEECKFGLWPLV